MRASKGVCILVPRSKIDSPIGIITQTESGPQFVIPWGIHRIIGTTETHQTLDLDRPTASQSQLMPSAAPGVMKVNSG